MQNYFICSEGPLLSKLTGRSKYRTKVLLSIVVERPWSSLVEGGEGWYLPNCQTNLVIALLYTASIVLLVLLPRKTVFWRPSCCCLGTSMAGVRVHQIEIAVTPRERICFRAVLAEKAAAKLGCFTKCTNCPSRPN